MSQSNREREPDSTMEGVLRMVTCRSWERYHARDLGAFRRVLADISDLLALTTRLVMEPL
jgi:hypothetical protein